MFFKKISKNFVPLEKVEIKKSEKYVFKGIMNVN